MLLLIGLADFKEEKKNFSGGEHFRVPLKKFKIYQSKSVADSFRNKYYFTEIRNDG